jgi:hypothetical protein
MLDGMERIGKARDAADLYEHGIDELTTLRLDELIVELDH